MAAPITPEKIAAIRTLADAGMSVMDISRTLKVGHVAVGRHVDHYGREKYLDDKEDEEQDSIAAVQPEIVQPEATKVATVDDTIERIARTRDLRRERQELLAVAGEKSFRAYLEAVIRDVVPSLDPLPLIPRPKPSRAASRETMLTVWSDWHAYETVTRERTMGFNEFNARILGTRVRRDVLTRIDIKDRLERGGGWSIPRLVIALNGDMISGTIHELERHSEGHNVVQSAFYTAELLAAAVADMSPHFEEIVIHCTSGNHGRLPDARRMQQKDPTRNWDTVIYLMAMKALARFPNVRFNIPDSYFAQYDIEGWNFLQTHGHDIKSWNSIPYYGIDRFGRNVQALHAGRKERIDYFIISHFHSAGAIPAAGGETIVNGSLIGGNEFSVGALGKADKPTQWMFLVHEDHGLTSRWPIYGDGNAAVEPYRIPDWPAVA